MVACFTVAMVILVARFSDPIVSGFAGAMV